MTDAPLNYHPENPAGVLVLLHGLGAAGDDLYPLAKYLCGGQLRVVCPHAPVRPVTVNGGMPMRAWYDIAGANLEDRQDAAGIKESAAQINALLAAESARGFATNKIFLGGFSQGAAMALYAGLRYAETLAGVIALSGYLLLEEKLTAESAAAEHAHTDISSARRIRPDCFTAMGAPLPQHFTNTKPPANLQRIPRPPHHPTPNHHRFIRNGWRKFWRNNSRAIFTKISQKI